MAEEESGEVKLPSEKELAALPRWARVAFAARCARRVQPLFKHSWPDAPQKHLDAVDRAITLAESSAESPVSASEADLATARAAGAAADDATYAAAQAYDLAGGRAAHAVAYDVAQAAAQAAYARAAADARAHAAADAAARAHDAAREAVRAALAMRGDYELLKHAAEREHWTDDTPVPPEFFGPIWPDGAPEGWPGEQTGEESAPHALKVEFSVPRGMNRQQSRAFNEKVQAFFTALSALDASMGGTGLQILDDESQDPIEIEQEEPVHTDAGCAGVGA